MSIKIGKTAFAGGLLMSLVYAGLALFFHMGSPTPSTDYMEFWNSNQF